MSTTPGPNPPSSLEDELHFALGMVEALTNNATVAFVVCDLHHLVSHINGTFIRLFGWSEQEIIGQPNPIVPSSLWPDFAGQLATHDYAVPNVETLRQRKNGSIFPASESVMPIRDKDGQAIAYCCIIRDISARKQAELALKISEQRYKSLFEQNPDVVFSLDLNGVFTSANASLRRISGYLPHELIGKPVMELVQIDNGDEVRKRFIDTKEQGEPQSIETSVLHKNGSQLHLQIIMLPIMIDEEVVGVYCIAKDITKQKEAEATIHYLAYHDTLTGLPNRRRFNEAIQLSVEKASVDGSRLAVLLIDLDSFKHINDSYGHAIGDRVLESVSTRLKANAVSGYMAARMGGDEFTVLLTEVQDEESVQTLAARLIDSLCLPIPIGHLQLSVTPSIGVAIYPQHGTDADTLLLHADTAMYRVKTGGKNGYGMYTGA
ncbi:diguanylate cyclase domain-containing protein [Paenibacillus allorhizosphaerae]|uniref:Diguanylate cyclase n=1 Tax=Paenibacillus allorhizosphaerae TaxID=2849866 RepID=A0ABM8VJF6_9BACL|nr:diguanylate cyclase [Paenibacillus allorhizosphaerae]CAG7645132.1 hypothetical protein PAECIP111802_03438 [Paenibacillus allorhizosphaerae]